MNSKLCTKGAVPCCRYDAWYLPDVHKHARNSSQNDYKRLQEMINEERSAPRLHVNLKICLSKPTTSLFMYLNSLWRQVWFRNAQIRLTVQQSRISPYVRAINWSTLGWPLQTWIGWSKWASRRNQARLKISTNLDHDIAIELNRMFSFDLMSRWSISGRNDEKPNPCILSITFKSSRCQSTVHPRATCVLRHLRFLITYNINWWRWLQSPAGC